MAQQNRSWMFDLEEGVLDTARLTRVIVDLVATGRTLEENDLEVREEIVECTARFVANRVSHKLRSAEVDELTAKLREASGG